eukprot:Rhum_TRINITY_DN15438_c4_g8::Rhum_TRINITY_DN15438_c4_g8_i2::g.157037::m.157037
MSEGLEGVGAGSPPAAGGEAARAVPPQRDALRKLAAAGARTGSPSKGNKGSELYTRGQKFLERRTKAQTRKKRELEDEELQAGPKINTRSGRMMAERATPVWLRSASDSPAPCRSSSQGGRSPFGHSARPDQISLGDVMRQCIDASQSVERMFSCSPPRQLSSESPDHAATAHPPDRILTLTPRPDPAPRAATAAAAAASPPPPSKRSPAHHHAATPPHPTRRSSSTGSSLADARRRREQQQHGHSTSQQQPHAHLHIQKSCHADGADILTCRGLGHRSAAAARTPAAAAPSELHRRLDEQARDLAAQRARLSCLEGAVAHLSLLAGVDAAELVRLAEQRRLDFFKETPEGWAASEAFAEAADAATASAPACAPHSPPVEVWIRISSFLCPRSEAFALRLVRKRNSAMRRAGDLCYLAWFKAERVRALGVGSSAFQRLLIPGAAQCRILLSHCDARLVRDDGTHERLGDRSVVSAPASIQLKGRGKGKVSIVTNIRVFDVPDAQAADARAKGTQGGGGAQASAGAPPASLTQELPQGSLTLRSVSPHVEATFAHARWYPLPGDSVVVIKAGAALPPLAEVASEASVAALLRNTEGHNPWTFKVEIPLGEGAPRGEYELRYIDSLARPLAFSAPFAL